MAYSVPIFNVPADVWFGDHTPADDFPDVENLASQFYLLSRMSLDIEPGTLSSYCPPIQLRLPMAANSAWQALTIVEVPSESGRYYRARFKEIMHLGFPNQYLIVILEQCTSEGVPFFRDVPKDPGLPPDGPEGFGDVTLEIDMSMEGEGRKLGTPGPGTGHGPLGEAFEMFMAGSGTQS